MEKFNISFKQLVPCVLGTLLFLLGLAYLPDGDAESIIAGIFAILIGACYFLIVLCASFIEKKNLGKFAKTFLIAGFPLYYLLIDIFTLFDAADYFELIGWIIIIVRLLSGLGILVFAILLSFKKDDKFKKIKDYSLLIFLCMLIVNIIFSYRGTPLTITGTSLLQYAFIACFAFIAFNALNEASDECENCVKEDKSDDNSEEKSDDKSTDKQEENETEQN